MIDAANRESPVLFIESQFDFTPLNKTTRTVQNGTAI